MYRHLRISKLEYFALVLYYFMWYNKVKIKNLFLLRGGNGVPKVAYSDEDRERIRMQLVTVGLELMAKQGIQHTTVEQVYKRVGISRTFFYSFFATKEDLILLVE